jgi:hypothetical protein
MTISILEKNIDFMKIKLKIEMTLEFNKKGLICTIINN